MSSPHSNLPPRQPTPAGDLRLPATAAPDREGPPVELVVSPASRGSLWAAFVDGVRVADGEVFRKVAIAIEGRSPVELTSCRYVAEPDGRGFAGRLVFLDDVYDFRSLLDGGRVADLGDALDSLSMVLAQREHIHERFKDFVADAVYDLAVHKRFFDDLDRAIASEPPHVAEAARAAILATEGRRFFRFFDAHLAGLAELTRAYTREEHERHGFYLRRMVWPYILGSSFMKRTNLKPRGYAGDAEMMQAIYENRYEGRYLFNQLLHKHPVEHPAAQAVRNRRRMIPAVLREVLARFPDTPPHGFRILSVACGPAWELQDLFLSADDSERFHCTLLDQDPEALSMAVDGIRRTEAARGIRISVECVSESVRTMLRARDLGERFGRHHFVYSMGLFDYLTTPVARAVLSRLWELVLPGGTLLVGNFHVGCASRTYLDYWCDWSLFYRTEEAFLELAKGLEGARVELVFEETRSQMFLRIQRAS